MTGAPVAVAMGIFDGVHLGHRALLEAAVAWARARGGRAVAVTFWPHPERVLRPDGAPCLLQELGARLATLRTTGVDDVAVLAFDRGLAALAPEEFVTTVLQPRFRPQAVFVGFNFRFGRGGAGDAAVLRDLCRRHGGEVHVLPPVSLGGQVLSSSLVRERLAAGDAAGAAAVLGRPYAVAGPVREGAGRGAGLGFPTANLEVPPGLCLPLAGVYAVLARVADEPSWRPGVANLGRRPTFAAHPAAAAAVPADGAASGALPPVLEVHLLDWTGDLRGCQVEVGFVTRLREERTFTGPGVLREQIAADAGLAAELLEAGAWAAASR